MKGLRDGGGLNGVDEPGHHLQVSGHELEDLQEPLLLLNQRKDQAAEVLRTDQRHPPRRRRQPRQLRGTEIVRRVLIERRQHPEHLL